MRIMVKMMGLFCRRWNLTSIITLHFGYFSLIMAFIMEFTTRMCRNSVFIAACLARKVISNLLFFPCDLPP